MMLCARCGGQCCQTRPGLEEPEAFLDNGDLAAALASALRSGNWVLEEHIGIPYDSGDCSPDPDRIIRYPRPATLLEQALPGWSPLPDAAPCIFLDSTGCILSFDKRPRLCRELEPDVCFECESPWGRREAALAWLPYQEMVMDTLRQLESKGDSIR